MKKYKSIILIILIFMLDLISKLIVTSKLKLYGSKTIINNFFNITYTKNRGAAFGLLSGNQLLIILISLVILVYLVYEIRNKKNLIITDLGLSMIIGGLLSNLSDRLFLGYVRDFLDFKIFNYNFAIFNVGDIAIVVGCLVYLIGIIMEEKSETSSRKRK